MIGIYKITSPSGKVYIGQSWDIERRFKQYKKTFGIRQSKLYNSIIKYGIENHIFEIIHEFLNDINQKMLDDYEILYWKEYKDLGIGILNTRDPGKGGKHSEETKKLMSEWQIGKVLSLETKNKISSSNLGKIPWNKGIPRTQEVKDKISLAKKGKRQSQEAIDKMAKALKGRIFSEETKRKISEAKKGTKYKPISEQARLNMSLAAKNRIIKNKQKI
jgi:group I intron endonuclease